MVISHATDRIYSPTSCLSNSTSRKRVTLVSGSSWLGFPVTVTWAPRAKSAA